MHVFLPAVSSGCQPDNQPQVRPGTLFIVLLKMFSLMSNFDVIFFFAETSFLQAFGCPESLWSQDVLWSPRAAWSRFWVERSTIKVLCGFRCTTPILWKCNASVDFFLFLWLIKCRIQYSCGAPSTFYGARSMKPWTTGFQPSRITKPPSNWMYAAMKLLNY